MTIINKLIPDLKAPRSWTVWAGLSATVYAVLNLHGIAQWIAGGGLAIVAVLILLGVWSTWAAPYLLALREEKTDVEDDDTGGMP